MTRITLFTFWTSRTARAFSVRPLLFLQGTQQLPNWTPLPVESQSRHDGGATTTSVTAIRTISSTTFTSLCASSGGGNGRDLPPIRQVGKRDMAEIIEDYENGGREESGYVVMDVRGPDEVMYTGKVSPQVITLPLPLIMSKNVFALDEEEFEELCGFEKPQPDETLVFTCAAGIRSQQAAYSAALAGYTNLVNYAGGANEWFQ